MTQPILALGRSSQRFSLARIGTALIVCFAFFATPALAQQTGSISGTITDSNGAAVAGVSIEASGNTLPQNRTTTSADNGRYRLPLLPPGSYEVTFTFSDGSSLTRPAAVLLAQNTDLDIGIGSASVEEIVVTGTQTLAETGQASLADSISSVTIDALPVGQEYRDLFKLIPGVQYSEDNVRGPSAGGNGQDNSYQFDGVDVSLPLFGTLSADPSSHDIAQVSVVRGGAKAIGFNRSGGFLMNTVSKSGTNEFTGEVSYQIQSASMTADLDNGDTPEEFDEDREWIVASIGGPIVKDRLFFYTSYYSPTSTRDNASNAYGPVNDFDDERDEFFGKLTFSPSEDVLLDFSYRSSEREVTGRSVDEFDAASTSVGDESELEIAILEGSWIIDDESSLSFKATSFNNDTSSRPDNQFNFPISEGDSLNIAALDQQGLFLVPQPIAGEDAYNAFIQPLIDQYGYLDGGTATGGGVVGGGSTLDDQDFARESFEISYDRLFYIGDATHELHIGYQYMTIEEKLTRTSNGWGVISVPGGRTTTDDGTPIFYEARFQQMSLQTGSGAAVMPIVSTVDTQNIEINNTIEIGDWTYNVGVMFSNDTLYGSGLAKDSSNPITGFRVSPGTPYKMYELGFDEMIQPRFGANWDYSDTSSAYINYAKYNPSASSLARAASWDRNLRRSIDARFDANGNFIEVDPVGSSSGKFFDDGLDARSIQEWLVGWTKDINSDLTVRAHARYRKGDHFWEDTGNTSRVSLNPPDGVPREPYIENLDDVRAEIGGSSFVIAELDGAFTKYYEASFEAEWNVDNWYLRGSYVWSHYYGNFDQDNATTDNDQNIFIGSSLLADGAGRQVWDFKKGKLRGDRRHMLKMFGFYELSWNARVGAYFIYQSGQPWEAWDSNVYRDLTSSTSDTIRYAEPAGARTTDDHYQLDLNYTQNFAVMGDNNLQLRVDLFNVFDNQTGYNIQSKVNSAGFGDPRDFYDPQRLQIALKFQF